MGDFSDIFAEAMTPGGLNEQALTEIRGKGAYAGILAALDSILKRLEERPVKRE